MKKILLSLIALGLCMSAFTQNKPVAKEQYTKKVNDKLNPFIQDPSTPSLLKSHPSKVVSPTKDIDIIDLGGATNPYGFYGGARTNIWADPTLNSLFFIHRGGGIGSPVNSGNQLAYDYTTDGGATWSVNKGPIYSPATALNYFNARYPQGLLYNPLGNTDPNNARFVYHSATTDGTNWMTNVYGHGPFMTNTMNRNLWTAGSNMLPEGMHVTQQGVVYIVTPQWNDGDEQSNKAFVRKGIFNTGTTNFDWTDQEVDIPALPGSMFANGEPASIINIKIAFAPDGQVGYILALTMIDTTGLYDYTNNYVASAHAGFYPVILKTTDGGNTWGPAKQVTLGNIPHLRSSFPTQQFLQFDLWVAPGITTEEADSIRAIGGYRTAFDADIAVDIYGNPHISTVVTWAEPTGLFDTDITPFSVHSGAGMMAMTHLWSGDGGETWTANILDLPQTFRGDFFGEFSEDNVPTVCVNYAGNKMFFTWNDTDTLYYPDVDNSNPDIHIAAFDLLTNKLTPAANVTSGTDADGVAFQGKTSYYVFEDAGTWEIPMIYQELGSTDLSPVTYKYIKGYTFANSEFTNCGNGRVKFDISYPSCGSSDGAITATPLFGSGSYTYSWDGGNNTNVLTNVGIGTYTVTVTNTTNGCSVVENAVVSLCTGVNNQEKLAKIQVYPNPAKDNIHIEGELATNKNIKIQITNLSGQVVYTDNLTNSGNFSSTINISSFTKGVYILQLITEKQIVTRKIVKY